MNAIKKKRQLHFTGAIHAGCAGMCHTFTYCGLEFFKDARHTFFRGVPTRRVTCKRCKKTAMFKTHKALNAGITICGIGKDV